MDVAVHIDSIERADCSPLLLGRLGRDSAKGEEVDSKRVERGCGQEEEGHNSPKRTNSGGSGGWGAQGAHGGGPT